MKGAKVLRKFNFRVTPDSRITLSAVDVPTLIPAETMQLLSQGDAEPYFKIQEIPVPVVANRVTYPASFFESYIGKLKDRPIPGSKNGHDTRYGARPNTDLYVVGGKLSVDAQGNGKVYLKNYIPKVGESGDNSSFIVQNKAGMLDYSIVSYTKDQIETLPEGEMKITAVASLAGERNDAVEYGVGAMEQKTNAASDQHLQHQSVAFAKSLISNGKYDRNGSWSSQGMRRKIWNKVNHVWDEYKKWFLAEDTSVADQTLGRMRYFIGDGVNVVYRALAGDKGRATQNGLGSVANAADQLMSAIDEKEQSKGSIMDKDELLKKLNALKQNGELTLTDVAAAMGLQTQVVNDEMQQAVQRYNAIVKLVGDDPIEAVTALQKRVTDNEGVERSNRLDKEFGPKQNAAGNENMLRTYAEQKLNSVSLTDLDTQIKAMKETDSIAKKLAAENADQNSDVNQIGASNRRQNQAVVDDGIPTINVGGAA